MEISGPDRVELDDTLIAGGNAMKNALILIAGAIAALLGGLWLLQGIGIVNIPPILCVADCAPIEGGSMQWAIIGLLVLAGGAAAIYYALRRRPI
jgi:hypothetical protein